MGQQLKRVLLGMAGAALACAASEGIEWNSKGLELYRTAHYSEAEAMYRKALDAFDRDGEGAGLNRALTVENIAVILRAQGRFKESEKFHKEALPRLEELTGPSNPVTLRAVMNLATLYWSHGELEQAEPLARRAESGFRDLLEASQADRSSSRQMLASVYLAQHRYSDANTLLNSAVET